MKFWFHKKMIPSYLDSDLCEDEDEGRSSSSRGFGCIRVNGNSATRSLKSCKKNFFMSEMNEKKNPQLKFSCQNFSLIERK